MTFPALLTHPVVQALGHALFHFVWQGSLLAGFLWLIQAVAQPLSPRFRYAAASLTLFAMPVLLAVTAWRGIPRGDQRVEGSVLAAVDRSSIHSSGPVHRVIPVNSNAPGSPYAGISGWAVCIWAMGVLLLSLRTVVGWIGIQNLRNTAVPAGSALDGLLTRLQSRLRVSAPVRLYTSAIVRVPTVFGYLRPCILLPISALTGLSQLQIEALLAHELAHIRRHDYVINALQTLVETLLFYHPAVWWVGAQMRIEREHCCDDIAVSACGSAFHYATALAEMEQIRGRIPEPALAATGGNLLERIRRLLHPRERAPRSATAAAAATVMILTTATVAMVSIYAQPPAPRARPEFEVASFKLNRSGNCLPFRSIEALPGGTVVAHNVPLRYLLMTAYDVTPSEMYGAPGFGAGDCYDVDAKAPAEVSKSGNTGLRVDLDQFGNPGLAPPVREMLQTLLETRLRLKYHWITEQRRLYALTVDKGGPKIKPSAEGSCVHRLPGAPFAPAATPGEPVPCGVRGMSNEGPNHKLEVAGVTIAALTGFLSVNELPVVDRTGLSGTFDITLQWSSPRMFKVADPTDRDALSNLPEGSTNPTIFNAVKQQLGLKLEETTGPVRVIVIEGFGKPSAN